MSHGPDRCPGGNVIELRRRNQENELVITHETLACRWTGEQMDYYLAVWGMQSRE